MRLDDGQFTALLNRASAPLMPAGMYSRAAVMMLLVDRPETAVVAIEKTITEGYRWSGQVALPGGRFHDTDSSPLAVALRELEEELGIPRVQVEVLGELGHFQTMQSGDDLHAFVGRWTMPGTVRIDLREVASVLEIDIERLLQDHCSWGYAGRSITDLGIGLKYEWQGRVIWGVTARILHYLMELIGPNSALRNR